MVQLILCHQWFRYWVYAKQTLLPEQIRIEFFIQQLGFNPRCWLIIKLASIFQSHIYPLNSACLSIGTFILTSRCCHWNCTKGCVLSLVHSWKVYRLHYGVIVKTYFQHYWPFVRETTGGYPSRRTSDVEHCCSLGVSLNKLLNKQYMSKWFDIYWSLFDVAVMIYNKIWMNTSHEIYMNPWLAINFSLCQKRDKCWKYLRFF